MKILVGVFALGALEGCVVTQPVLLRSAPTPTAAQIAQTREAQTRVIAVPIAAVFPKAIEILFDNGYVVSAADGQLGFIAFLNNGATLRKAVQIFPSRARCFSRSRDHKRRKFASC